MKKLIAYFGVAIQSFKSNIGHTLLSTLGIVIGVAALVSILSLGDGMERYGRSQIINTTDLQQISIQPVRWDIVDGIRIERDSSMKFSYNSAEALFDRFGDLASSTLSSGSRGIIELPEDSLRAGAYITGIWYRGKQGLPDLNIGAGKFLDEQDTSRSIIINSVLAHKLFPYDSLSNVLNKTLHLRNNEFIITGIQIAKENETGYSAYVPLEHLQSIRKTQSDPGLRLLAYNVESVQPLKDSLELFIADKYGIKVDDDFRIITNEARLEQITQGIFFFKLIMGLITGISVLVGGIGVMNVLLMSISERTREIGIRKAIGATRKDISLQFLIESLSLSIIGSVLGFVLGISLIMIVTPIIRNLTKAQFHASLSGETVFIILLISIVIGLFFGTYPAYKASKLTPVDAIRHE